MGVIIKGNFYTNVYCIEQQDFMKGIKFSFIKDL